MQQRGSATDGCGNFLDANVTLQDLPIFPTFFGIMILIEIDEIGKFNSQHDENQSAIEIVKLALV
jgi:hypothetical protein